MEIINFLVLSAILGALVFCALAWEPDIKPMIFTKPKDVELRPEFKLGCLVHAGCLFGAALLFVVLQIVGIDSSIYRALTCIACLALSIFLGNHITKRMLRRIFFETAIANRMNPEDYAKTLSPHFVVEYIESHLHDKKALEKQIKYHKSRRHISEACAWAFLVAYCDKRP